MRRRTVVVRSLVEFKHYPRNRAHKAAVELGISKRAADIPADPASNSLPYCQEVPAADWENSDWPHHARIYSIA